MKRGNLRIVKDNLVKVIVPTELDKYISDGWVLGCRDVPDDVKIKISNTLTGRKQTSEAKAKRSKSISKLKWFNNGIEQGRFETCPNGWTAGRLRVEFSDDGKRSLSHRGMHVYNNGEINIMSYTCPDGFVSGRINTKNR